MTSTSAFDAFIDLPIDTMINSAANVKHFSRGTDIEDINIGGVKNGIAFCKNKGCRFLRQALEEQVLTVILHLILALQKRCSTSDKMFLISMCIVSLLLNGLCLKPSQRENLLKLCVVIKPNTCRRSSPIIRLS